MRFLNIVNVEVIEEECPYCHQLTKIGCIETQVIFKLRIYQCGHCQWVWKIFEGKTDRMIRCKEDGPQTDNEYLLCPTCWKTLEPDYEKWAVVCRDPTCGYSRRLPGLNKAQRETKDKYFALRHETFNYASKGEAIPEPIVAEYSELKREWGKIKKFDCT